MSNKPIHTLNARGNVMLEVMRDYFKLSPTRMLHEIQAMRNEIERVLAAKGVSYGNLKSALVPDRKRREIALVFDTLEIEDSWYGYTVLERVIPLFDKRSSHSVLLGDYIDSGSRQPLLHKALTEAVHPNRNVTYKHSSQFFIVYINNLTDSMVRNFDEGLADFKPYIGFADTTYASAFKVLLSTMLVNGFIKHRNIVIQGHEPDLPESENTNISGYPFEEHNYICRSISSDLKGVLLSFKIERPVLKGFEVDTEFSLNAISPTPLGLDDFAIQVNDAKLNYIKGAKSDSVERAGLERVSTEELASLIASKISDSYIYNMAHDAVHNVAKFNVIIEVGERSDRTRLLAALEYRPNDKVLRLITLY